MSDQLLPDPMQSEIIVIENKSMIEWIQIELAKHFGISANIIFMNLISFIKKISYEILPNDFVINDFNCSIMYWKLMEILPETYLMKNCSIIQRYLCNDINQRKCGQLSEKLVNLFIKYLIYRPDWLDYWKSSKMINDIKNDPNQLWQSTLWRALLQSLQHDNIIIYENINYLQNCIYFLQNTEKINNSFFPKRIFIFGIMSMPSIYWKILNLLSNHIDIYLWFTSPYYTGNYKNIINSNLLSLTTSYKYQVKNLYIPESLCSTIVNNNDTINNSANNINCNYKPKNLLLDFCGRVGENTLLLLNKLENLVEKKIFFLPKEDSLLHILQKNILEFQSCVITDKNKYNTKILKNQPRYVLELEDQSITFHACYNIQREIEILHNNILLMLQDDPFLLQKGIIVMAPNIYNYIEIIKTVFNNVYGRNLPFVISSNCKKITHPIISTFLKILNLSYSRCTFEEIFSFLEISLIASKFNIQEEEVELLHQWVIESGIKWGLDDITMHNLNLPVTHQNTWNFGLTRMLLGYAIDDKFSTWQGINPYDGINEEHISIIGQLGEFLRILQKWRNRFNHSHSLKKWIIYIKELFDDFFDCSKANIEENKMLSLLKDCWKNILESGIKSKYFTAVNIIVLRDKLYNKLNQNIINYKFLPNVINFCNITPICYIPCKIICLLGMNENVFPRNKTSFDFDLVEKNLRNNDHNIYEKDCYSFLLIFLLAQERIYISFIENLTCNNTTVNDASVLIHILLEHVAQYFYLIKDKNLDINNNINRIRSHLCQRYSQFIFSSENFISDSKIQSFANEWVSSAKININIDNVLSYNFITPLPFLVIKKISFYDLYNFYRHPIKTWFNRRLGIYFNKNILKLSDNNNENFSIDIFHRFNLNTKLVHFLIHNNNNINKFYNSVRASGVLPYGAFGELCWIEQYSKMLILADQIKTFYSSQRFNLDIFLEFDNVVLTGQLIMIQKNGLVRWKSANISMKDNFLLWLEHLVYCALGNTGDSRLFGVNDMWHFPNLSKFQAKKFLFFLISGYLKGINAPLLLLYKSGGAWMEQVFDWKTRTVSMESSCQEKALYKLIRVWKGINYPLIKGENCDPYIQILISNDLNKENIKEIIKTAEDYFLFPMKHRML